jgi:TRAP-type C4-dicarboxylate transport system substrate-binding protein
MSRLAILTLAAALVASGCFGGSGRTKAGAAAGETVVLTMETPDAPDSNAEFFIRQVQARTHGHIRIVEAGSDFGSCDPDNESRLVAALQAGNAQMAYIPSRAWERSSPVRSFRALQAPLLVQNYPLLRRITTGPIGRAMLAELETIDLVGLGLVADELRRPLGVRPLSSADDFDDARIRIVNSPTSEMSMRALGSAPTTGLTCTEVPAALREGAVDGIETAPHPIESNDYVRAASYLTSDVPLFAKTQTIAIRRDIFDRLSPVDRAALRAGASATALHANPGAQETAEVRRLCENGLIIVSAGRAQRSVLRREADRGLAALRRDSTTRRFLAAIETAAAQEPNSISSLHPCNASAPASQTGTAFPEGQFTSPLTAEDFERGGATQEDDFPHPWAITIREGRWATNEEPSYGGRYFVHGDRVTFLIQRPPDSAGVRETLQWSYFRARLSFRIIEVADAGSRVIYAAHPWTRTEAPPATTTAGKTPFPEGTYQTRVTRVDLRGEPFPLANAHTETLTFRDGTWRDVWSAPARADQPPAQGTFVVRGNVLRLEPVHDVLRWSYYRGQLTLGVIHVADSFGRFTYTVHPWRKVK